jgi:uncharacterized protein (DUF885 family)
MSSLICLALLGTVLAMPAEEPMSALVERFVADFGSLDRYLTSPDSDSTRARRKSFAQDWLKTLDAVDFDKLDLEGRVDWLLLGNRLKRELRQLELDAKADEKLTALLPFAPILVGIGEARARMDKIEPEQAAATINEVVKQVKELRKALGTKLKAERTEANRGADEVLRLNRLVRNWYDFHAGYDPLFTWWVQKPYEEFTTEMKAYADEIREKLVGIKAEDKSAIVGRPVGREALLADLQFEMIPLTPEELIDIANREFAWCEKEAKRAADDLGFKGDWKKALEHVKTLHVKPGDQPSLVRELALEAIAFLEKKDLVTVPPLAKETWRMSMMSPEAQKTNPFFLGGEQIIVSFPTNTMTHDEKLMSMRGNNRHFSKATVQHELIPGHHLQGFMMDRYRPYRSAFGTPFWIEGWALYWEMLLWDQGFALGPEDRVGMLFWRMHRCARIIFSLRFHLGEVSPQQCIDFLVDRVGHERANAEGEVRRSFSGAYPPLYQLAYMVGGLQFRALHQELVGTKKMSNREFHDAILKENQMPIEMVRAILTKQKLTKDFVTKWRFGS